MSALSSKMLHKILYGNLLENNPVPNYDRDARIYLKGEYNARGSQIFGINEEILSKHMLLIGGTGTGKTNLFYHITEQLKSKLTPADVMLIFDSKGDFYDKFYNQSKDIVIGNSQAYRKISEKWNIYREIIADGKDKASVYQNTQEICRAFFAERTENNSNNPFFPNAARDLLASIIIALIRDTSKFNNIELRDQVNYSSREDLCSILDSHSDLRAVSAYISGKANSQSQGVLSEMYSVTRDILTGVFCEAGNFSMREFVRNKGGRTAFIEYDMAIGDLLTPVYTLLFDLALKEALGRSVKGGNVYLIADELKLLPRLRHLDDGINFGRSLGVKIMAGLQSIDQLSANYNNNEARARNAIAGFSSVFAFRSNDFNTREYVSKLFGKNITLEGVAQVDGHIEYERNSGFAVEDWDLINLRTGEAVVGLPLTPPFKFRFEKYDK